MLPQPGSEQSIKRQRAEGLHIPQPSLPTCTANYNCISKLTSTTTKILGCYYFIGLQRWTHFLCPLSIYFGCSGTDISEMGKTNTTWTVSTILSHSDIMERQEEKRRKNSKKQTRKEREVTLYWNMSFIFSHWQFSIVQYRYFTISDALTLLKGEWRTNICAYT